MYAHRSNPTTAAALAAAPGSEVYAAFRLLQARLAINTQMRAAVFTDAERLRANDSAYQCDELKRLARWLTNVTRVAAEREANPATVAEAPALFISRPTPTMWLAATDAAPVVAVPTLRPRRTADYAGELAHAGRAAAFQAETGLSYAELAQL